MISPGGKDGRCVVLTALTPSCADDPGMGEPQLPGTLRACPGFTLPFNICNVKTVCCPCICARLISPPSFRSTAVRPVTSPHFPVLIINQISYGAVKFWTCLYVLVTKEGSLQLLQRRGFVWKGFIEQLLLAIVQAQS